MHRFYLQIERGLWRPNAFKAFHHSAWVKISEKDYRSVEYVWYHQQEMAEQTHVHHITVSLHCPVPPFIHNVPITVFELWTRVPVIWSTVLKLNCQNNPLHCSAPDVSVYDEGREGVCKSAKVWIWLGCDADIVCACVCLWVCVCIDF